MKGMTCPHCGQTMYSAHWEVDKVKCIFCNKEFSPKLEASERGESKILKKYAKDY